MPRLKSLAARPHARQRQAGAATLIVVMVLFFVMSLVAAYASRNIIFEQRTSANQFTGTASLAAAEAGLEWAISLLNGTRINDNCQASTNVADPSFRERYLTIDAASANITVANAVRDGPLWSTCWFNKATNSWTCHCPRNAAAPGTIASTPTDSFVPSFRVRFAQIDDPGTPTKPGIVRVEVLGCTQFDLAGCLTFPTSPAASNDCRGTVCGTLALSNGVKSLPLAALTAKGPIDVSGAALVAANPTAGGTGYTILAGGTVNTAGMTLNGPAGMPPDRTVLQNDAGLSAAAFTTPRMFAATFGAWPATYLEQQGLVTVNCTATCDASTVRNTVALNPGLPVHFDGNVTLNGGGDVGSAAAPVVMIVSGDLTWSAPTDVYGLVYVRKSNWASAGTGQIVGAVVAEGQISGNAPMTVIRDATVLNTARARVGSFVMIPGGWKDFP